MTKMPSLRESAKNYVPQTTKNIADLKSVDVDLVLFEAKGIDPKTNEEYSFNYIEVNGEKYRVPDTVRRDLKAILDKKPSLKTFAVTKQGEGRNTKYTIIPLD